jgi:hypothetical protein
LYNDPRYDPYDDQLKAVQKENDQYAHGMTGEEIATEARDRSHLLRNNFTGPWIREDGLIKFRPQPPRSPVPNYLGPFAVGDKVIVNSGIAIGVIEYADATGMLVVPEPPHIPIESEPGAWFPATGIHSITPFDRFPRPPVEPDEFDEPSGIPDESLPMNPPPTLPPEQGMF